MSKMRFVNYDFRPESVETIGNVDRSKVGVIAQEVAIILPDAVKPNGKYLAVDDV